MVKLLEYVKKYPELPVKFFVSGESGQVLTDSYTEIKIKNVQVLDVAVYDDEYYTSEELESHLYDKYSKTIDRTLELMDKINSVIDSMNFEKTIVVFF